MVRTKKRSARALGAITVALAAGAFASPASALSVSVAGGLSEASVTFNDFFNDGVARNYAVGPLSLALQGAPAAQATFTFLFQESGFNNRFIAQGSTLNDPGDLYASVMKTYTTDGILDFSFESPLGTRTNAGNSLAKPNFGVLFDQNLSTLPAGPARTALGNQGLLGQYAAILFLNDGGAAEDRDFDDMVIGMNVTAVPEPGMFALVAAGLLAVGWMGRRTLR